MKKMFLGLVGLLLAVFMVGCNKTQSLKDVEQMTSPNGEVKLMFALTEKGEPMYRYADLAE